MSKPDPKKTTAPVPKNYLIFDPWNTASSGYQRAESNPGTSWQRTREAKLAQQLRTGDCTINSFTYGGRDRVYEKGEWEWDWGGDARQGRGGPGGGRGNRKEVVEGDSKQRDIRSMMRVNKADLVVAECLSGKVEGKRDSAEQGTSNSISTPASIDEMVPGPFTFRVSMTKTKTSTPTATTPIPTQATTTTTNSTPTTQQTPIDTTTPSTSAPPPTESTILRGAIVYINGQTAPMISDHKLKQLLIAHGATLALGFSRRVTHVIIGKPNAGPGRGAGGGLAAGKIQKEIQRGGWRGMRIVGVEWVLESIRVGKRLPETKFVVNLSNQRSVLAFM